MSACGAYADDGRRDPGEWVWAESQACVLGRASRATMTPAPPRGQFAVRVSSNRILPLLTTCAESTAVPSATIEKVARSS